MLTPELSTVIVESKAVGIGFGLDGWRDSVSVTSVPEILSNRVERQTLQVLPYAIQLFLSLLIQFGGARLPLGGWQGGVGTRGRVVRKSNAAVRPIILDRLAPPVANTHSQLFAETVGRDNLIIDMKEQPFLLLRFHPFLHLLDGMC